MSFSASDILETPNSIDAPNQGDLIRYAKWKIGFAFWICDPSHLTSSINYAMPRIKDRESVITVSIYIKLKIKNINMRRPYLLFQAD